MPIGAVVPPSVRPDDEPLICVTLNQTWLSYVLGAILPMKYPEYWSGTLAENRQARRDYGTLLDMLMQESECDGMSICCTPPYVIQRVNPDTGMIEVSTNNGASWSPLPDSIPSKIVEPIPPVTSGTSATKCDAVINVMTQIEGWITHVTNDFDTATDLFAFGVAVISAIADAVLLILSEGALTALEGGILAAISAAVAGVYAAGKTVFANYWTDDEKKKIKCAVRTHMGDDGSMTDAQFSAFWTQVNEELTGALAKMLFMGFLSSIGRQGINAMAASAKTTGGDCSDCVNGCDTSAWTVYDGIPVAETRTETFVEIAATLQTDGHYYVVFGSGSSETCCEITGIGITSGSPDVTHSGYWLCHDSDSDHFIVGGAAGHDIWQLLYRGDAPFSMTISTETP